MLIVSLLAACKKQPSLRVVAAGDLQLGAGLRADPLAQLGAILDGDLRFANLEGPFARDFAVAAQAGGEDTRFAFDPARAAWLRGRFDVVSLANNHALDRGVAGRDFTVEELRQAGVAAAFDGHDAVVAPRGRSVIVLARAFAPDADLDAAAPALVAAVARAREHAAVLVSLHWGHTGLLLPSPEQRRLGTQLVDAGATAILGHGPHTAMGVERRGRGVIAYSLGNLAFGCDCTDAADAFALELTIGSDGGAGGVTLRPLRAGLSRPAAAAHDAGLVRQLVELAGELGTNAAVDGEVIHIR